MSWYVDSAFLVSFADIPSQPKRRVPRVVKTSHIITIGTSGRHRRIGPNVEVIPVDDMRYQNASVVLQPLLRLDEGYHHRRRPSDAHVALGPEAKHRKGELAIRIDFWNFANRGGHDR
jgi:hypothetical protein